MSLYPADRWYNHSSDLIGIVKNGKLVPPGKNDTGKFIPEHVEPMGKINLSEDDTIKWINYTLDKPDGMFARSRQSSNSDNNNSSNNNNRDRDNNNRDNIVMTNNGKAIGRFTDGKLMEPKAGYYDKFVPSK